MGKDIGGVFDGATEINKKKGEGNRGKRIWGT